MRRVVLALGGLLAGAPALAGCGDDLPAFGRQVVAAGGIALAYAPRGGPIETGRHFSLDIVVCAPAGAAGALRIDADMPLHRHGMNYRPTVTATGDSRFRADGLMFHMPGRWRLLFDVGRQRLQHEVDVE